MSCRAWLTVSLVLLKEIELVNDGLIVAMPLTVDILFVSLLHGKAWMEQSCGKVTSF